MADNVQLQGIEFEIVGESEKAAGGVKKLTSSLKKLQAVAGKGLGLDKIKNEIKDLNDTIGNIRDGGLIGLATSISNIANASRKLGNVHEKLKNISDLDFSNLQGASQSISSIADTAGWKRGGSRSSKNKEVSSSANLPALPSRSTELPSNQMDEEYVEGSTKPYIQIESIFNKASFSGEKLKQILEGVQNEFGKSAAKAKKFAVNLIKMPFQKLGNKIKNTLAPLQKFTSSLARIALYRAVRFAISSITQALKEGISNLYAYSKAAGTTFHGAMNSLATDALWLKNSLASAVAPLIESLMPAIDALATKIANLLNMVAQLFAMLGGRSTYSKAIKSATEYGEATGTAAKEMRMLISGFDELNAFPEASSGGGAGADVGSMFEEAKVDSNLGGFIEQLKKAIKDGDWEGLGGLLGDKVNEFFERIDWEGIGSKLGKAIDAVIRTAYSFLKTVDFKSIGADIATLINSAIDEIDFKTAGGLLVRKFTALLDLIVGFITTLDWDDAATAIGNFFRGAFNEAIMWLYENDVGEIATKLSDGIIKILDGILEAVDQYDWALIGEAIGDFLGNIDWIGILSRVAEIVWDAFTGMLSGLLSTDGGRIFLALVVGIKGLKVAFTVAQPYLKEAASTLVQETANEMGKLAPEISKLAPAVGKAALGVFDVVMAAYDTETLIETAQGYNEALIAHNKETETALTSYSKLYREKGKEVADEWAGMVYQIDTTNATFDEAQQLLAQKIEGYWDGVPQNMWDGFKQGWNYYFGEGGKGLFALLGDAFTGAVNGIKNLLGIHSPSTVFNDIGVNLVDGLKNGIGSAWSGLWTKVSGLCNSLINGVKKLFGVNSPSIVFEKIGGFLDAGLEEGMEGGIGSLIGTAGRISSAVTAAMTPNIPEPDAVVAKMNYAVSAKAVNSGYESYSDTEDGTNGIITVLEEMFEFLRTSDKNSNKETKIIIDGREVFNTVVNENNRAIQRTGASPIRV